MNDNVAFDTSNFTHFSSIVDTEGSTAQSCTEMPSIDSVLSSLDKMRSVEDDGWPECDSVLVLLALNEAYSELITHFIYKVEKALDANKKKQKEIFLKQRCQRESEVAARKKVPVIQYLPPYFKDDNMMCPPLSEEAKRKLRCTLFDPLMKEEKKWSPAELRALQSAVKASMLQNKIQPLLDRREILVDKVNTCGIETSEMERSIWKEEMEIIDRKILFERSLPENQIFVGDYSNIDWARIATIDFKGGRTPASLRLKWINEQCPRWNKDPWTKEELNKLKSLKETNFVSWAVLADRLGTKRTPWQCFEKYKSELCEVTREWTKEEDEKLIALVNMLKINGKIQWDKVTYYMPGRHRQQVRTRYMRTLDKSVKHGRWTDQEDLLLMCAVSRFGAKDWSKVAKAVPGRSDGQCRERWCNVLERQNKISEWTLEEDEKLLYGIQVFGRGSWAKIAQLLPNRRTDMIRRRYHTLLTTKMRLCVAQLDRIRLSSLSSKVSAAVHNIRRNRVFRQFNEMVNGDDESGEKLCEQVREQTFKEPTGRQLYQMKQRMNILTEEERAIVEKGIEAIAQKYRDGDNNVNVLDLVKGIELTESDIQTIMKRARKQCLFRRSRKVFQMKNQVRKIRKTVFLLADAFPERTEFTNDIPEEERIMCLTEALCQAVRKYDQHEWNNDFAKNSSGISGFYAEQFIGKVIGERCTEAARCLREGQLIPCDCTLAPTFNTIGAHIFADQARSQLTRLAAIYFNRSDVGIADDNFIIPPSRSEKFTIHDRLNIQLATKITQSNEYFTLKAQMRAVLLEAVRLEIACDSPEDEKRRIKTRMDLVQREMEDEGIREGSMQFDPAQMGEVTVESELTEEVHVNIGDPESEAIDMTINEVIDRVCGGKTESSKAKVEPCEPAPKKKRPSRRKK